MAASCLEEYLSALYVVDSNDEHTPVDQVD